MTPRSRRTTRISGSNPSDDGDIDVLEDLPDDATLQELTEAIEALNADQHAELLAMMWIGRGDWEVEDWAAALEEAASTVDRSFAAYLTGTPLLGDLLEEGYAALGYSCEEYEMGRLERGFRRFWRRCASLHKMASHWFCVGFPLALTERKGFGSGPLQPRLEPFDEVVEPGLAGRDGDDKVVDGCVVRDAQAVAAAIDQHLGQLPCRPLVAVDEAVVGDHPVEDRRRLAGDGTVIAEVGPGQRGLDQVQAGDTVATAKGQGLIMHLKGVCERQPVVSPSDLPVASEPRYAWPR